MICSNIEEDSVIISGNPENIKIEMLKLMKCFMQYVELTPDIVFGMQGVKEMFETEPNTVTDFTRMFIKATQQ